MPYQPRPLLFLTCAHCDCAYTARHVRSTYCSRSCNVRASYARTGRRGASGLPPLPVSVPAAAPLAAPVGVPEAAAAPLPAPGPSLHAIARQLHEMVFARSNATETANLARRAALERILGRPTDPAT